MTEPGIYFGLAEEAYHADPALGSTDLRKLAYSPPDFWHARLNPARPADEPTPAQAFGRAVHRIVLEGRQAFEGCYAATDLDGRTKAGKDERAAIDAAGKVALKRDDFDRCRTAGAMIGANPHLAEAFCGGMPEVSVFWNSDGIPKKARFDYFKMRSIVDLKSIRNSRSIDFVAACRRAIAEWNYPLQAEHYREARGAMAELVRDGAVHGDHDPSWLALAAAAEWAFVFAFWQAEGAPLTWATVLSPGNPILEFARRDINRAVHNYATFMDRFGPDEPWLIAEPLAELDLADLPPWFGRAA